MSASSIEIPLTKGMVAIVDKADLPIVAQYKWYANWCGSGYYATTSQNIRMHRLILGLVKGDGLRIDHRNHNRLDNRRENLRVCTHVQNMQNSVKRPNCSSIYKGVRRRRWGWESCIYYHKKYIHLGTWPTEHDAARAYNKKAKELFGDFANFNKVSPQI